MSALVTLAGVGFDPTIRGILVVLVGAGVLMGSVWLLLSTNSGPRVGTLLSLSAVFGWIFIMGIAWWIYGIGWIGDAPTWHVQQFVVGDLSAATLPQAQKLPNEDALPTGAQLVKTSTDPALIKEYGSDLPADRAEGLTGDALAKAQADWKLRNETVTLSEVKSVSKATTDAANLVPKGVLNGWRLMSTAESGEAVATASNSLFAATNAGNTKFTAVGDFKVLDSFDIGGKVKKPLNPKRWDRIAYKLRTISQVKSPPHYAIVQVQRVIPQTAEPGEAPPRAVVDPSQPVYSVIMERDLGFRRLRPAIVTIVSLILFLICVTLLHYRDKEAMARLAVAK
jgi:hypothetical protein